MRAGHLLLGRLFGEERAREQLHSDIETQEKQQKLRDVTALGSFWHGIGRRGIVRYRAAIRETEHLG